MCASWIIYCFIDGFATVSLLPLLDLFIHPFASQPAGLQAAELQLNMCFLVFLKENFYSVIKLALFFASVCISNEDWMKKKQFKLGSLVCLCYLKLNS